MVSPSRTACHCPCDSQPVANTSDKAGGHATPAPPLAGALARIGQPQRRRLQGRWHGLVQQRAMQAAQRFTLAAISRHGVAGSRIVRQAVVNGVALIFRQAAIQPGVQVVIGNARAGVVRVHDGVRFGHFRRRNMGAPLAAGRAASWLRYRLCIRVNNQARRSLPVRHSSHLLQARSSVSCTRSSAAQASPVSTRA
jgi:hypothetical protein